MNSDVTSVTRTESRKPPVLRFRTGVVSLLLTIIFLLLAIAAIVLVDSAQWNAIVGPLETNASEIVPFTLDYSAYLPLILFFLSALWFVTWRTYVKRRKAFTTGDGCPLCHGRDLIRIHRSRRDRLGA